MEICYKQGNLKHEGEGFICDYSKIKEKTKLNSTTFNRLEILKNVFNIDWKKVHVIKLLQKSYAEQKIIIREVHSVCIIGFTKTKTFQYVRKEYATQGTGATFLYMNGMHKDNATKFEKIANLILGKKLEFYSSDEIQSDLLISLLEETNDPYNNLVLLTKNNSKIFHKFVKNILDGNLVFKKKEIKNE